MLSFDRCLFCFGGAWLVVVDDHWGQTCGVVTHVANRLHCTGMTVS